MKNFDRFHNKKIAILGYGREGKSTLQFLLHIGVLPINITILDWASNAGDLQDFGGKSIFGSTYLDDLSKFDSIIKTPGISLYHPKILPYKDKIMTQAQIFFDYYPWKIIAISGTKWKSTTSTLTYETLKNAGKKVELIGNIGKPMLDYLNSKNLSSQASEYVVAEISSYMLEDLHKTNYLSVLLNIYADHGDWHQWFENYKAAKLNILQGSKYMLLRDEISQHYNIDEKKNPDQMLHVFWYQWKYTYAHGDFFIDGKKIFDDQGILLKWEHNRINICAVLGICDIMGIAPTILKKTLITFKWLPHRMEYLWIFWNIQWIDDAISTTPESTIQAIKTFGNDIDTIFLGGTDRGYVFDTLIAIIRKYKIRNIVLFPDSGSKILATLHPWATSNIRIFQTSSMKEAVTFAYTYTRRGKICLLSTASPSYSIWKNFEEKGNFFKQYIEEISK